MTTYTGAFDRYGARLTNPQWSVSAFGNDGSLVVSLWFPLLKFDRASRTLSYSDVLSQWKGNHTGRGEFIRHLQMAKDTNAAVMLVIAHPANAAAAQLIGNVPDESVIPKTFESRENVIGTLEMFDGDALRIVFRSRQEIAGLEPL
jgi:hypothetical protein